jgi:hypothetical protein
MRAFLKNDFLLMNSLVTWITRHIFPWCFANSSLLQRNNPKTIRRDSSVCCLRISTYTGLLEFLGLKIVLSVHAFFCKNFRIYLKHFPSFAFCPLRPLPLFEQNPLVTSLVSQQRISLEKTKT